MVFHREKERKQLLYVQIAEKLKTEIRSRKLRAHDPVPSEGELAKKFGVSRMTTKLALESLAKQGIVYRLARRGTFLSENGSVWEAEDLPAYTPKVMRPIKKRIAILVPNMDDYISRIISSVENEARKSGCHLLIKITTDKEDESECLQELYEDQIEGIILYPRGRKTCSEKVLRLNLLNYPLVIIDRIFREVQIDCVYHDHYQGAYNLTQYLIAKGHKEIGYVSMIFDGVTSREDRYQGYLRAMLDHNLPINSQNIFLECTEDYLNNLNASNPQLETLIGCNHTLTALVCADDYVAASCLYTAIHMNKSVPEQLSIVGFTDIQLASLLPVPLTTGRQTTEKLGEAAVNLLMQRMDNSRQGAITIKVNTSIVERSSVRSLQIE
ncbi:DNA-binding transcriptional regulator, LacI/PurR family [Paenibacillus sp. GP183]|nr:DNA-binding transcriptional regulator, LacI/PurR family [Paenibacillus sp. GP183]